MTRPARAVRTVRSGRHSSARFDFVGGGAPLAGVATIGFGAAACAKTSPHA